MKVHIDPRAYTDKPAGDEIAGIKTRLQKRTVPVSVTVNDLVRQIETGHSISPAVMCGMSAADWREQQLFMVDVDNERTDAPVISSEQAVGLCLKSGLPPVFYYHTFSHSRDKPKFRIAFLMDRLVTDPGERRIIMETLISLFRQSDRACLNADRIFLGTNKEAVIHDENARISMKQVLAVYSPPQRETQLSANARQPEAADPEVDALKRGFDFLDYLIERNGEYTESGNVVMFKNCEVCGHKDNLRYYKDTNTFYCFSSSGEVGGSIIEYLMATEGITLGEAIEKLKYELSDTEWRTPTPLEEFSLPVFPVEQLPAPLDKWVHAVSENTATPVDMAAVSALALVAAAVQGKFTIKGKADYYEPLNLYILIIAKSGERKSAVVRIMTKVIYQYEKAENNKRLPEINKQEAKIAALKQQIKRLEQGGKSDEADQKRIELQELESSKPKLLRLIADDATPEALTSLLASNDGVLTIISTEGGMFDTLGGKYSDKVSIDTVLKAHIGDPIRVDRIGRESEIIESPALTMLLAAQDNVLNILLDNEIFKSRGLTARFLYCKPTSTVGTRKFNTPEIPSELESAYNQLILDLLNIHRPKDIVSVIKLDQGASALLERFHNWLEPKLAAELEHTEGWGGKFLGTTLRIAGILHCVEHRKSASAVPVSEQTMQRAMKIGMYFLKHAKYAYSMMGADKSLQGARAILKKLKQQNETELTKYQIFRLCRGQFTKADDVLPSLTLLMEYGYLKLRTNTEATGGRPKGSTYILNPMYFKK